VRSRVGVGAYIVFQVIIVAVGAGGWSTHYVPTRVR
jgi:hypothetical protein